MLPSARCPNLSLVTIKQYFAMLNTTWSWSYHVRLSSYLIFAILAAYRKVTGI